MTTFDIRLFGPIEVARDGQPVSGFRSLKTLVLLAYLIVEDRLLTRDFLAGILWPETSQSDALGHLRRALHNLTTRLPECLDVDRRTVRFRPDAPAVIDVRQFTDLLAEGDTKSLAQAAGLARAPFLEGVYLADCLEIDTWITAQQEHWRHQAVQLLERLCWGHQVQGDVHQALDYARQWVRLDPWREDAHCQAMRLLAQTSQRNAALNQFEICRKTLEAELGLPVSAKTVDLYERIRHTPDPRHNLPVAPTPFIGRQAEVTEAQTMLANPDCRLVTVVGPGGMGKTRLALEAAAGCLSLFLEGVWYADLAAVAAPDLLPGALAAALDLPLSAREDTSSQLLDYLRSRELLLVLDNFEHLADDANWLAGILAQAPGVKLLVTSRQQLQLQEEWLFELGGLSYPPDGIDTSATEEVLLGFDAVRLFVSAAQRVRPGFDLGTIGPAVVDICQLVQGVPLALELAAAWVRSLPCDHIAVLIREDLNTLAASARNVPERHRSMAAVFNQSWQMLDEDERRAFASLSVFRGGFTLAAVQTVAGQDSAQLQRLIGHSLLYRPDENRYEVHELLRQYALDKLLQDKALTAQVLARHAAFYLALLDEDRLEESESHTARAAITTELGNVMAAWGWALDHARWDLVDRCLAGLARYYIEVGEMSAGISQLAAASQRLEADPQPQTSLQGLLLAARAHLLARSGFYDEALHAARQALALADNPLVEVEAQYVQALAYHDQGDYAACIASAEPALQHARQNGLGRFEALLLNQLGRCYLETKNLQSAQTCFEETLALAQAGGHDEVEISAWICLSLVQGARGRYASAETHLLQALALAERYDVRPLLAAIHLNLGTMLYHQGKYAAGQAHYAEAVSLYRQSGNRARMGLGYYSQAIVALGGGDLPTARRNLLQAIDIFKEKKLKHREANVQHVLAQIMQSLGQYTEARQLLVTARELIEETGAEIGRLASCWRQAWLSVEVGDYAWAESLLEEANALLEEEQPLDDQCLTYLTWSRLRHYRGDLTQARHYGEQALRLARGRNQRLLPECAIRVAYVAVEQDSRATAWALFEEAHTVCVERNQSHLAVEARAGLAHIALTNGDLTAARAHVEAILAFLDAPAPPNTLEGTQEPFQIYLICYQVLQALGDVQATVILEEAYRLLQQRAARLIGDWRRSFLEDVPPHRAILAAWGRDGGT